MADADLTAIALPTGGGAVHGLGEKFAPDLFTGTGNFTVPLAVPSGRHGLQPDLSLRYSTGTGNGPFGFGWQLSVPGIARRTSHGVPRYADPDDVFVLSGAEDLVPVAVPVAVPAAGRVRYRPRSEGLFARIERVRDDTGDFWEVRGRDGVRTRYGTPRPAGALPQWLDPAAVADPADPGRVFAWRITETRDPLDNLIRYEYLDDTGEQPGHRWRQPLLARILYADYGDRADPDFLVTVEFDYEHRPDPFSEHRAGFEVRSSLRCRAVRVVTGAADGVARHSRTYQLDYTQAPFNGVSLLSRVETIGFDEDHAERTPPVTFGYAGFDPGSRRFEPLQGRALPATALSDPTLALVDLRGAGLPDLVELGVQARFWRNTGGGRFDVPRRLAEAPPFTLADRGVRFLDADGDGRTDLMVTSGPTAGYFPMAFAGGWSRTLRPYRQAPSVDLADARVKLVDLDGDGLTDVLRSGTGSRLECWFNDADPAQAWHRTAVGNGAGPQVDLADPRVRLADMTGDHLPDIVLLRSGNIRYWPNLGHGRWGEPVTMRNAPRLPDRFDPRRVLLGDVDGDGAADLVYVADGYTRIWGNRGGNEWTEQPITIAGTPAVADTDTVQLADVRGTGMAGVLYGRSGHGGESARLRFLDLTGGVKPYLLNLVDNHLGATTRIHYRPSTEDFLRDDTDPRTRWRTTLPFPVQVVGKVEVLDAISGGRLTTQFRYRHGYWDGVDREFRGFAMVEQRDTESFDPTEDGPDGGTPEHFTPPTLTRSWFHPGPVAAAEAGDWTELDLRHEYWAGDPVLLTRPPEQQAFLSRLPRSARRTALRALRGQVLRTELYGLDGTDRQSRPYTVTEAVSGVREEAPGAAGRERVFFAFQLARRDTQWERGEEPMTQFAFYDGYDTYGLGTRKLSVAVPRGRDPRVPYSLADPYLATRTETRYAQRDDSGGYLVDRVAEVLTSEVVNDGTMAVAELQRAVEDGAGVLRVIGHTRTYYDGQAFNGLPLGVLGAHGLAVREESLAFTDAFLDDLAGAGTPGDGPGGPGPGLPDIPGNQGALAGGPRVPYLDPSGATPWPAEYPAEFRDTFPALAGYVHTTDPVAGFYVLTARHRYDVHVTGREPRGLLLATLDPLGAANAVDYDQHDLLPVTVTDPAGLRTTAAHDYRLLQPREMTDVNGNVTSVEFSPSGLVTAQYVRGKDGTGDGTQPGTRTDYDLLAYAERGQPASVRTVRRLHHDTDTGVPAGRRDDVVVSVEYSDGFGRVVQSRAQAEDVLFGDPAFGGGVLPADQPAPTGDVTGRRRGPTDPDNVLVSGWQRYDNKGRVVQKYEAYFATGYGYAEPLPHQRGLSTTTFYDPRGQAARTVDPDGSEQRFVFGVPADLADPDHYRPTPWETYTYGSNDNAGRTHGEAAGAYRSHWNTPASVERDALGRTVTTVIRNGPAVTDWFTSRSEYDLHDNLVGSLDPLGRQAYRYRYDLTKRRWRIDSLDGGRRDTIHDAAGAAVEHRDSKGAVTLAAFDALRRPSRVWARDDATRPVTLRQRIEYGDAGSPQQPPADRAAARAANLLGRPVRHHDEAGLVTTETVDCKGNVTGSTRRVVADAPLLAAYASAPAQGWRVEAFQMDWTPRPGQSPAAREAELLDPVVYATSTEFDAVSRISRHVLPGDVQGRRREVVPSYNRSGALDGVRVDGDVFVQRIAYDTKGQRVLIAYGNGVLTRHAYDPLTLRQVRLRSERYTSADEVTYRPAGEVLQDIGYEHDLLGNILTLRDRTPGSGIPGNPAALTVADPGLRALIGAGDALDRRFTYDPVNRLLSATGREHRSPPAGEPWAGGPRGTDPTAVQAYTESYQYDAAGSLRLLRHDGAGAFTRRYTPEAGGNRLARMEAGVTAYTYTFDGNGNMTAETATRHFEWNHADQLRSFAVQTAGAEPSVHAQYLYDATGRRVKKLVRRQGGALGVTHFVDDLFEHYRWTGSAAGSAAGENTVVHVMDDGRRVARVRVGAAGPDDGGPPVEYHLPDHLGSTAVVVDGGGAFVNREEFTPYGETSFGGFARKRYRFVGRQREAESGLDHFPRRYFAPWLARWTSCDPAGGLDGAEPFAFCGGNPVNRIDRDGGEWCWLWEDDCEVDTDLIIKTGSVALSTVEVVVGCPLAETGIGAVACINGLDDLSSTLLDRPTLKQQAISGGLQTAGVPEETAEKAAAYGSMVISAGLSMKITAVKISTTPPRPIGPPAPPPRPSAPVKPTPRPTVPPPPVAPAVRRVVQDAKAVALDNSVLNSLAKTSSSQHQAALDFLARNGTRPLTITRATFMEALGSYSKGQLKELLSRFKISFDPTVGIEQIGALSRRFQDAFKGTRRAISDTDAMQMAGAVLSKRRWVTADIGAYKRAVDLGIDVEYVGDAAQRAQQAKYVRQPVTVK